MLLKYEKNQYNYMYRMVTYFIEQTKNEPKIMGMLDYFRQFITTTNNWMDEDGIKYIVLDLGEREIAILLYIYENVIFYTVEGQRIMNNCEDMYSKLLQKRYEGGNNNG